jgi:pimeloyl-ACP methyl ester carboxylesterase
VKKPSYDQLVKTVVVPGYGDETAFYEWATRNWDKLGLDVEIHPFGTVDPPETYDQHWQQFKEFLEGLGRVAIVGVSFGGGPALRAQQELSDLVNCVVCISAPHNIADMDIEKVRRDYPMLKPSLEHVDINAFEVEKILTVSPLQDGVVPRNAARIEGATNLTVPVFGHPFGIGAAFVLKRKEIARFVHSHS